MELGPRHWIVALLLATALHVAVLGWWRPLEASGGTGATPTPQGELRVSLALAKAPSPAPALPPDPRSAVQPMPPLAAAKRVAPTPPAMPMPREPAQAMRPTRDSAASVQATKAPSPTEGSEDALAPPSAESPTLTRNDGVGEGAGSALGEAQAANYFSEVARRVAAKLHYPARAQRRGVEGVAILLLRIDRAGALVRAELSSSSGDAPLDLRALEAARSAAPFGPVPDSISDAELEFEQPVHFELY